MKEFSPQELEHRAAEAKRLRSEPMFIEFMQSVRDVALEEMATLDPMTQVPEILKQQAIAAIALKFSEYLDLVITAGGGMDGGNEAPE